MTYPKLEALRKAISFGRKNQIEKAISALANWLDAEGVGLLHIESGRCEIVASTCELPKTLPCSMVESNKGLGEDLMVINGGGMKLWVINVPTESPSPSYFFAVYMPEGKHPNEIELQIAVDLLASWLGSLNKEQRLEQLARAFRVATLGELASGIAHEINNPLQVIMGNAELILDTAKVDERTREKLEDIILSAEQIRKITRAMTHFADARRNDDEKELLDFGKVVQEAAQLAGYSLVREGVKVKIEISPTPQIWGRRGDIEEIVVQLVRNAGEAIAESGKGSQVTVRVLSEGKNVRLEVEDDGPGVPLELRERIFDPFVTTKATRGGTGLGLAIVQNLVTAHGGGIWLEDSPTGGAKFIVELPT